MTPDIDIIVIGAGVVGLAIACALQQRGRSVYVLEKNKHIGMETSARNSEVIHAGIYYPPGSLKARFCVAGKSLLYRYCEHKQIPYRRIGKLIIAVNHHEIRTLQSYQDNALKNGVDDLVWLDTRDIHSLEPDILAVSGLYSPSTGIIDSHALMQALCADFEAAGGVIARQTEVLSGTLNDDCVALTIQDTGISRIEARCVINAAGLTAPTLARRIGGIDPDSLPNAHFAIGHYFTLQGKSPFRRLVYPVASGGGLGVHVTLDLAGQARLGPDISWRDRIDYRFDESRKSAFADAIKRYYPGLDVQALQPGYTGIRPKISGPDDPSQDFFIKAHCLNNKTATQSRGVWINLLGIESPGLTSALAIAVVLELGG